MIIHLLSVATSSGQTDAPRYRKWRDRPVGLQIAGYRAILQVIEIEAKHFHRQLSIGLAATEKLTYRRFKLLLIPTSSADAACPTVADL